MSDADNSAAGAQAGQEGFDDSKLPKFSEIDVNTATPEMLAEVVKSAQTLLGQRNHWRDKAIDPATKKPFSEVLAEAKKQFEKKPESSSAAEPKIEERLGHLEMSEEKRQFGHENKLSPEETDNLFAYAKGMNQKPADALKNTFFTEALKAFRQASKNGSATPNPSARAPVVEGKSIKEMNTDEKRKNFSKIVGALRE